MDDTMNTSPVEGMEEEKKEGVEAGGTAAPVEGENADETVVPEATTEMPEGDETKPEVPAL